MPEDTTKRFRDAYEAFNSGGVEAILERLSPEIEIHDRESAPDHETYHGRDHLRVLVESTMEAFEELRFEPEEVIEVDDHVVVVLRQRVRGRGSGANVEATVAHLWTMQEGRAVGLRIFRDREKAPGGRGTDRLNSSRAKLSSACSAGSVLQKLTSVT